MTAREPAGNPPASTRAPAPSRDHHLSLRVYAVRRIPGASPGSSAYTRIDLPTYDASVCGPCGVAYCHCAGVP